MRIRVSKKLYQELQEASYKFELSIMEIIRRAARKYERLKPEIPEEPSGPVVLSLTGVRISNIRDVIAWYLQIHKNVKTNKFSTDLIEGRDYVVDRQID